MEQNGIIVSLTSISRYTCCRFFFVTFRFQRRIAFFLRIAGRDSNVHLLLSFSLFLVFPSYSTCTILPPSPSFFLSLCTSSISLGGSARFRAVSNSTCVSCISKLVTRVKAARSGESNCIESQDIEVRGTELFRPYMPTF